MHQLADPALARMPVIVRGADLPHAEDAPPESAGIAAVFDGISDGSDTDDERLARGVAVCDALFAYCQDAAAP